MTDTILIIGGRLQAIQKAKELGLQVVFLQHKERLLPGQAEAADALILANYLDRGVALPLVRAAHEVFGFDRVVSLVDQAMELVGEINDMLRLPGTSYEVAHRFHDKLAMRDWLRSTGFESVAAQAVADVSELAEFVANHGCPVVLKPVDGTGSRGVLRIDGPAEVESAWRRATELRGRTDLPFATFYPVQDFMVEEYIDGPEYSVETFSFGGRHIIVTFTDKLSDGAVEMGHAQPAVLSPEDEAAMEKHIVDYLTAMGLTDGVGCMEIKMSSRGPRIIEGHDRVAGDRLMDLMEAVYGIDLERYAVGWPHRLVPELTSRPVARCGAATRFLSAEPGTVLAMEGVDEVRGHPGVLDLELGVGVDDEISAIQDNFDRPGQLLVTARDTAAAVEVCDMLARRIRIVTGRNGDTAEREP